MAALRLTLVAVLLGTTAAQPQKFDAGRFVDMLSKTFDPDVALRDLYAELQRRLNIATPTVTVNASAPTSVPDAGTGSLAALEAPVNCPDAPPVPGTVITYTNEPHVKGSRAFYQCEIGYSGGSLFVQCQDGGQWSSSAGYPGCAPIDCGNPPPSVDHGIPSLTSTTYGSRATYSCTPGYKLSTPGQANVTCLASGSWDTPTFTCDKISVPQLNPSSLSGLSSLFGAAPGQPGPSAGGNPMMEALMKAMSSMGKMPGAQATSVPPTTPAPPTPTPQRNNAMAGGFQLPSHLQSLLPSGMTNTQGMNPSDLMALATAGLGSSNPAAAPRSLNQLIGGMNPMQALFGGPGMGGLGGVGGPGAGGPGGPGMQPDPEKAAEQREEMMMRAMMATAMKSMMAPRGNMAGGNSTNGMKQQANPAMDMFALMALGNGLGGAAGGGGGLGGAGGMDPAMMMLGGMNPSMLGLGAGPGAGLFGGGGGASSMFANLGSLFGA